MPSVQTRPTHPSDLVYESQSCGVHVPTGPPPPGRAQQSVRTVQKEHEHHLSSVVTRSSIVNQLKHVDHVPSNAQSSQGDSKLYIFEDGEAVIKMIIKGRSPTIGHVSRTHRVALNFFVESTMIPRSKSDTLIPRINSLTF